MTPSRHRRPGMGSNQPLLDDNSPQDKIFSRFSSNQNAETWYKLLFHPATGEAGQRKPPKQIKQLQSESQFQHMTPSRYRPGTAKPGEGSGDQIFKRKNLGQ